MRDLPDVIRTLRVQGRDYRHVSLPRLAEHVPTLHRWPVSLRVLLENGWRNATDSEARAGLAAFVQRQPCTVRFRPSRVLLQDLLGVPLLVDLAALRDAVAERGGNPRAVNPVVPVDCVIDHSLMAVFAGSADARGRNEALEQERNHERFHFLRWCAGAFERLRVIPPGQGILHQLALEHLGHVVTTDGPDAAADGGLPWIYPETLVGTDSHTPMINALGVLGWGVGGLEAEAAMLGRPLAFPLPAVVGVRVHGRLREGVTATDLVLTLTERLRAVGVVDAFVEFTGPGLDDLSLSDRATIANMAPEYGATCVYFPVDRRTMDYLRLTGRPADHCERVEAYMRAQQLWRETDTPEPEFDRVVDFDLAAIVACVAGPRRPQDRVPLPDVARSFATALDRDYLRPADRSRQRHPVAAADHSLGDGDIVIAAITSCTNTSNPAGMVAAGLVARRAVHRGLRPRPWVKTSLAPGSRVVAEYLRATGLQDDLDALGFNVIGFGCTTCNGMSGPLAGPIREAIETHGLVCAAVLSGNRNFEARIHPNCRANYLASAPLVVAYAIAGSMTIDVTTEPLAHDAAGRPVFLRDLWPTNAEIDEVVRAAVRPELFQAWAETFAADADAWSGGPAGAAATYDWDGASTYLRRPPYFESPPPALADRTSLRPLAILGDSITTDHISPSGAIGARSPAGEYLRGRGVVEADFNTYGTRRGNHEVGMRATFANVQLRNEMAPDNPGGFTRLMPEGRVLSIFDAANAYRQRGEPTLVIAGQDYGAGSSRDWAAKGLFWLGVRAVLAESFERIHRTNLVCMGILPLEFTAGATRRSLALDGSETYQLDGLASAHEPGRQLDLTVHRLDGSRSTVPVRVRLDTPEEREFFRSGGILPCVLRDLLATPSLHENAVR